MLLKFRLLCFPDIFLKASQKAKIWKSSSASTSALDSLVVVVSESLLFSSNYVRLALVVFLSFSFIGETSVLEYLQPFFLVTVQPTVGQSQRSHSMLMSLQLLRRRNWQELFLRFCPDIKNIWQERKLTCDETTRPIICDNWRCTLIRGFNAP